MSAITLLAMFGTVMALAGLWHLRALSPNLMLILVFLFVTGNTELLLTLLDGKLPESLWFIDEVSDLEYATLLFDIGLLAMTGGMWSCQRYGQNGQRRLDSGRGVSALSSVCVGFGAIRVYAVLFVFAAVLNALISGPLSPLAQLFIPLLLLRFFPIYVLAYRYFTEGRDGSVLLGLAAFEIVANLSFFAAFKDLFIVLAAALMLAVRDGARFRWLPATTVALSMVLVMSAWTYVKSDFREYLSDGERVQIDKRTLSDKLDFMKGQLAQMGFAELGEGLYNTVLRVAYNGYFAATTRHVPAQLDHTGGAHLMASALAMVTPRFLFPDKPVIEDSEIVLTYTGLVVAGASEGTSINIGQFGELYGDLGILGMCVALALLGCGLAAFERMIFRKLGPGLDASAWTAVFVIVYGVGIYSLPKLVAAFVYTWLAAYFLLRFVYPAILRQIPTYWVQIPRVRRTWR